MTIDGVNALFFTVGFLVPGFVWSAVLSTLLPARQAATEMRFLEFITLSCINHGLWSWLLFPLYQARFYERHPYLTGIILFVVVFLSPVVLGIVSGRLQQTQAGGRFLRWLGLRTVHPIPCAWDWHFSREKPYWVLVTLKDGSRVHGLYHERSFAASDPNRRDLYIEAQFEPLESGEWAPLEDTGGVLIVADQIATIEFRRLEGASYE